MIVHTGVPKALLKVCQKYEERIEEVDADGDGFWVYLKQSWWSPFMECRTIHEDTVADIKDRLEDTEPAPPGLA